MTNRITLAAMALTDAFHGDRLARLEPEAEPLSEVEAYAIQEAVLGGEAVAGWKVAPARNGVIRCAPLGLSRLLADGDLMPPDLRAPLIEVELALHLARDIPAGADAALILAAIGGVSLAFEILDSRFVDRKAVSPLSALADAQSNRAFVAGRATVPWPALDCAKVPLTLRADGGIVAETPGGASSAQVAEALIWLAAHAAARGRPLRKGQIIITGSRLGPMPLPACRRMSAEGGGVGTVSLILHDHPAMKEATA